MENTLKIILVSPLPPPAGGIATWTLKFQAYCIENDIPLTIVNSAVQGGRAKQINSKRQLICEVQRTYDVLRGLKSQILKQRPDVVHVNTSCSKFGIFRDLLCVLVADKEGIPTVIHCRCNVQDQVKGKMGIWALRTMANRAQKILTLNQQSFEYVSAFAPGKTITVPNFIEQVLYERPTTRPAVRDVLFVGHVQRTKGAVEIIQAAEQLPEMRFILLGPVQADVAEMTVPNNVELRGNQPHDVVLNELKNADLFLFPSYTEGFANALTEAMAAGLPVITTDVGANAEMIEDRGGIIVPVGESEPIVAALNKLKDDVSLREAMSTWNVEKVRCNYLREPVMQKLFAIYREVI